MAHDVFISYSHKDKPIADGICANLEGADIRCWIAPRDIAPGEDWPTAISNAISAGRAMVLIFSSHSNASEDVSRELYLAANSKLVIIPFKIEDVEPEPGKQYYLARTHWLDAMNPPTKEQIQILVNRVRTVIQGVKTGEIVQPKPDHKPSPEAISGFETVSPPRGASAPKPVPAPKPEPGHETVSPPRGESAPKPEPAPKSVPAPKPESAPQYAPAPRYVPAPRVDSDYAPPASGLVEKLGRMPAGGKIALSVGGLCLALMACLGAGYGIIRLLGIDLFPASATPTEPPTSTSVSPTNIPSPTVTPVPVQIRWFVGLGTGTDPAQVAIEQAVVADFNASHDNIELILEIIPYDSAKDTLSTQIAAGEGPDVVGPVGFAGSNAFKGQWLDFGPYMDQVDQTLFNPALITLYQTEEGQVGLPFAVYPSMTYYNTQLFDEADLNYPPDHYGDRYVMPDGRQVEWSWDTVAEIGRLLTIDANGYNTTEYGFDSDNVVQYGFHWVWENHAAYFGAYFTAGSMVQGAEGAYTAVVPYAWKAAWEWHYNGIWGEQPFIPNAAVAGSPEFGGSNTFDSGRLAMAILPNWYLCCLGDFANAGNTFDFGILPSYNGQVHGRVDADTIRIWKGTRHPDEAFEVMYWLVTVGIDKLVVGSADLDPAYGAVPAITSKQQLFLDTKAAQYPFITHWDTMMAGLSYPDVPSAEGWMPNYNEAWARLGTFSDLMNNTAGLDLAAEIAKLEDDLTVIFNK